MKIEKCMMGRLLSVVLSLVLAASLTGCALRPSGATKIATTFIDGFEDFYELGKEYEGLGLTLQADYAYGWAGASVSAMRYCVDSLLYMKGEGKTLEDIVNGRLGNWDEIAALNFASPYPYYFEGLVYNAEEENDYAQTCYEKALMNPAFSAENCEALAVLEIMPIPELKELKKNLTELEDRILAGYEPENTAIPRYELNYSDAYLRTAAKEQLAAKETDYRGALRYYKAALAVNPFEGDNFVGCALMCLFMDDIEGSVYYVNEGLFVDPEHAGLLELADQLNGEAVS